MRKYICSPFGEEVDLDDSTTYDHLPKNINELRQLMLSEIGYSYCYMNYWHRNWFDDENFSNGQKQKVENLIKIFTENERDHYHDVLWYQEQIFIFQDEIENMC